MKRLITLMLFAISAFNFKASAQTCNAGFNFGFISLYTASFTPQMVGDSAGSTIGHHSWDFGDGTPTSSAIAPSHYYASCGTYLVKHIFWKTTGNGTICSDSSIKPLVVYCITTTCNANFTASISGNSAHFTPAMGIDTNYTVNTFHTWTFGDGSNSSNLDPVHYYANCGTYSVTHVIKKYSGGNLLCTDSVIKPITIQCNTLCNAQFNAAITGNSVNFSTFPPSNPADTLGWSSWYFGDGSSIQNPFNAYTGAIHTYANCGTYTVYHRMERKTSNGTVICGDSVYKVITIQCPTSCSIHAKFSFVRDSIQTNRVYFTNLSTPTSDIHFVKWSFGDGTFSNDYNAVHTYLNSGAYTVCLQVRRDSAGICKDDTCMVVQVQMPPPACNLQAYFSWYADSTQFNKIHFINQTVNLAAADSIKWTFGDGTESHDVNPVHTYANAGTYNVCLTVKRPGTVGSAPCVSTICKTVVVAAPCNLVANFTWAPDPLHPTKIHFTNTSVPLSTTDSIRWTFGDGTSSTDVNPDHTYNVPGVYTVCLRVKKNNNNSTAPCVREICKTVVISSPCNLQVDFSWHADSIQANKIYFTNLSGPLSSSDSIRWTFGDGTSSTDVNPTHLYSQPGTYTVCLKVKKNNFTGTTPCVKEICKTITVTSPCNFQPAFSWHADSINHKKVYFNNLTVVPTAGATATWTFGDGSSATSWNAVHEYAQPGRYYVCLKVQTGPNCIRYTCDSISITGNEPPCNDLAKFAMQPFSNDYLKYKFIPTYQNPSYLYIWSFGDGTGSNSMIAEHRYNQPGLYHVCLTVFRNNTCVSTVCKELRIYPQLNCDSIHVSYQSVRDAYVPNKYYFYAISNFPLLQQRWTFKRISPLPAPPAVTLYQNNPVYVFQDTGVYQVCLRAITLGGCVKEYCSTIHVTQVLNSTACMLQAYPNPVSSDVNVNVQLGAPEMIHAYVYNALNVLVKEKHQQGVTGNNVVTVNVANLVAGWYTIKLIYGNKVCYARFQKL